jgi:hypothetical protein
LPVIIERSTVILRDLPLSVALNMRQASRNNDALYDFAVPVLLRHRFTMPRIGSAGIAKETAAAVAPTR